MVPEQNLLTGIFAVQLKFVTPQELVLAGAQWALHQDQDICAILLEHGAITTSQADLLRQLTEQQIQSHGGDASAALQTFGGGSAVEESFAGSIIFERETGVRYRSVGRVAPQTGEGVEHSLPDPSRLITEYPDRYTTRGEQGRGAVGRVLIVYDEHIGREIALKELLPDSAAARMREADSPRRQSTTLTARFLREARITGQLEHPGIVPVHELGQREDGTTYYTMKLVRGQTLADRLRECRSISDRLKLLPHFLDLCQAIAYAHSRGVIHRDIKPGNVMIGEFGETVLLDWGLAKVKGQKDEGAQKLADEIKLLKEAGPSETVEGKPIGTPSYMSPEQADGRIEDIDERSDVWSLGAVLYEILTGQPPFRGSTALEVIDKVLSDAVTPVLAVQKDAPVELAAAAVKCLQREHQSRYLNVESIADDISAFLSGGIVSAYTYSTGLLMKRWAKRNWAYLGAAAAVFMVLAVAILILVSQNNVLVNRQVELLVRSLSASASSVRQYRNDRWQLGMLLALQARNFELRQTGSLSSNTADSLRKQLNEFPLGSIRLTGQTGVAQHLSFSPDSSLLAIAGDDGAVHVWHADDLQTDPQVLKGHEGPVRQLSFSPDGSLLTTAGDDGAVRVWQFDDLTAEPQVLEGHQSSVHCVAFSPDGSLLVTVGGETAFVWQANDLSAEPQMLRGQANIADVTFSPNSSLLASGSDKSILIWRVADLTADPQVFKRHEDAVLDVTFSPDSHLLASAAFDGTILVWQVADLEAEPRVIKGHEGAVVDLAFSPGGALLASTGHDQTVRIWQVNDLEARSQALENHEQPNGVFFSPNGEKLVTGGEEGTVRVWEVADLTADPMALKGHEGAVRHSTFSPDGSLLATAGADGTVRVWPVYDLTAEPQVLKGHAVSVWVAAFAPDGSLLATAGAGGAVRVWQVDDLTAEPHILTGNMSWILGLAFSPDGRLLAAGGRNRTARVWQVADLDAEPQALTGHESAVRYLSFSPDGSLLATAGREQTGRVWQVSDLTAEPQVLEGVAAPVFSFHFSPDGSLLAAGSDSQTVQVWQVADLTAAPQVLEGFDGSSVGYKWFSPDGRLLTAGSGGAISVFQVADLTAEPLVLKPDGYYLGRPRFSPDGRLLAAFAGDAILVWQVGDLTVEPRVLRGHEGGLQSASFSPDGSLLASAGNDKTVRIWQTADLNADPQVLEGHTNTVWFTCFSPDGTLLVSASGDATVRVWQTDINAITATIEHECFRNLSWSEWQMYVGSSVPYEKTIPALPLGADVPFEGAIADKL